MEKNYFERINAGEVLSLEEEAEMLIEMGEIKREDKGAFILAQQKPVKLCAERKIHIALIKQSNK